jgi:hypothetical protein
MRILTEFIRPITDYPFDNGDVRRLATVSRDAIDAKLTLVTGACLSHLRPAERNSRHHVSCAGATGRTFCVTQTDTLSRRRERKPAEPYECMSPV